MPKVKQKAKYWTGTGTYCDFPRAIQNQVLFDITIPTVFVIIRMRDNIIFKVGHARVNAQGSFLLFLSFKKKLVSHDFIFSNGSKTTILGSTTLHYQ
jgi:hypothetical protein